MDYDYDYCFLKLQGLIFLIKVKKVEDKRVKKVVQIDSIDIEFNDEFI